MNELPEIIIPFDRFKLLKLVFFGLVIFVMSAFFIIKGVNEYQANANIIKILFLELLGLITFIFSAANGLVWFKKLLGANKGLILNGIGFIDKSGSYDYGVIRWCDVNSINTYNIAGQDSVSISVKNKEKYRELGGGFNRFICDFNIKYSGTPIHITSKSLKINNLDLANKMAEYFEHSKI